MLGGAMNFIHERLNEIERRQTIELVKRPRSA